MRVVDTTSLLYHTINLCRVQNYNFLATDLKLLELKLVQKCIKLNVIVQPKMDYGPQISNHTYIQFDACGLYRQRMTYIDV